MKKTASEQSSTTEPLERVRLQADVAKQRVRIAKDELKRARKRLKEAKREAKRARKVAAAARKAWKRARRAQKGGSKKATAKTRPSESVAVRKPVARPRRPARRPVRRPARRRLSAALRQRQARRLRRVMRRQSRRIIRTARPGRPIARRNRARLTPAAVRRAVASTAEPSVVSAVDNATVTGTPPDQAP
jgi:hypothetical protein